MAEEEKALAVMSNEAVELRKRLVDVALDWEKYFGIGPNITNTISEFDSAVLVGMEEDRYCADGKIRKAVTEGFDFLCGDIRYQVTANRPSGKPGSPVSKVGQKTERKKPFGWDRLIWMLYDRSYVLQEAWEFTADEYRAAFSHLTRLSPSDMRKGRCLFRA